MVTENILPTQQEKLSFLERNIRFVTALDIIKGLKQILLLRLLLTCAPIYELPSIISTMI